VTTSWFHVTVADIIAHVRIQDFKIKGTWTKDGKTTAYGYDFWYQPRFDVVISSEFGSPNAFKQGFDPSLVVRVACKLLSMHSGYAASRSSCGPRGSRGLPQQQFDMACIAGRQVWQPSPCLELENA
jgi:56kDa selenium binding protein (SBP56)